MTSQLNRLGLDDSQLTQDIFESFNNNGDSLLFCLLKPIIYSEHMFSKIMCNRMEVFFTIMTIYFVMSQTLSDTLFYMIISLIVAHLIEIKFDMITKSKIISYPLKKLQPCTLITCEHYNHQIHLRQNWLVYKLDKFYQRVVNEIRIHIILGILTYAGNINIEYSRFVKSSAIMFVFSYWFHTLHDSVHYWYHCPHEEKKQFHTVIVTIFYYLERLSILNSQRHYNYHINKYSIDLNNHNFPISSHFAKFLWESCVNIHKKTKSNFCGVIDMWLTIYHVLFYCVIITLF